MTLQAHYDSLLQQLDSYRASDPLLYLKGIALAKNLADAELRFTRAEALQALAARLLSAARMCDYPNDIVVRREGVFVDVGGILMESSQASLYLKASGARSRPQGELLGRTLEQLNINVATAVDVGANFGEISLWLARAYREARIVAIEPSSDNLAVFARNKEAQSFPTDRIEIIQGAVSNKAEVAAIQRGANTMSRVVATGHPERTEPVQCERLDVLFYRLGIGRADFVKIDIEGGEPKLRDAMVALGSRVRSYYIEFSQFAPLDDYMALAAALLATRFACYDETASAPLATAEDIARHLRATFSPGPMSVANLWFVAQT